MTATGHPGIGTWPARQARRYPDAVAVRFHGTEMSYDQFHRRVLRAADSFRLSGVRKGDRIAYCGANHPAFIECFFAAAALGAVFVPLNMRLSSAEIADQLQDCTPKFLVHDEERGDAAIPAADRAGVGRRLTVTSTASSAQNGGTSWEIFVSRGRPLGIPENASPDDLSLILYTSGTTGRAKGVMLSHANLTWNCMNIILDQDLLSDEVSLVIAPLFHAAALSNNALPIFMKGGTLRLLDRFDPDLVLDAIEREGVTHLHGVPTILENLTESPRWSTADLSTVRRASSGGSAASQALIDTYLDRGIRFSQGYGMTEAGPGVLYLPPTRSAQKVGAVGRPHFFVDVRLVDSEGAEVQGEDIGEVVVRGPNTMGGYWKNPEATRETLRPDGWLRTGDLAKADCDGDIYIVDRLKEMYISGGENVYPAEVEAVIRRRKDVLDCAVVGVPNDHWGEVGKAYVVVRPGAAETPESLRDFLRAQLAHFKVPTSIDIVEELPRNPSGKLKKNILRERALQNHE